MAVMHRVLLLCFIACGLSASYSEKQNFLTSIINDINSADTTWKAGQNFHPSTSKAALKRLCGVKHTEEEYHVPRYARADEYNIDANSIPAKFDAREHWPKCDYIGHVSDQGNCGSCWALATTSVMTDRFCIETKGKFNYMLSADDLLTCCMECGFGCDGGCPCSVWWHLTKHGIVTGGDHKSSHGCKPYSIRPCDHHVNSTLPLCSDTPEESTPNCVYKCPNRKHKNNYWKDSHKLLDYYHLNHTVEAIQQEIMAKGPVLSTFTVYEDFFTYRSGVYQHVRGENVGGHAVKIIGWGEENKTPYWLIVNSWNKHWGENGLFKMRRGNNECYIESGAWGAIPDLSDKKYYEEI